MALNSKWFKGNEDSAEKAQLELTVRNARHTLDLLSQIIEQEIRGLETSKFGDYDMPNWPLKRADRDGQVRALTNILKLTKLDLYQGV